MTYTSHIATLIAELEPLDPSNARITKLLHALGCRTIENRGGRWMYFDKTPIREEDEPVALVTLSSILEYTVLGSGWTQAHYSILDGLCQNDRWEKCLLSEKLAYNFATILLHYSYFRFKAPTDLTKDMSDEVLNMLTKWLRPEVAFTEMPSMEQTAKALFGEPLWDVIETLSGPSDIMLLQTTLRTVMNTHPAFLPGLAPRIAAPTLPLPTLDAAP